MENQRESEDVVKIDPSKSPLARRGKGKSENNTENKVSNLTEKRLKPIRRYGMNRKIANWYNSEKAHGFDGVMRLNRYEGTTDGGWKRSEDEGDRGTVFYGDDGSTVYSVAPNEPLNNGLKNDEFSVFVTLRHNGDETDACTALRSEYNIRNSDANPEIGSAELIKGKIELTVEKVFQQALDPEEKDSVDLDEVVKNLIDMDALTRCLGSTFWSGEKSKMYFLNQHGSLVIANEGSANKFIREIFGQIISTDVVDVLADIVEMSDADKNRVIKTLNAHVSDHIKINTQREQMDWHVDMWAEESRIEMTEDKAAVYLTHKPFVQVESDRNDDVVEDFKQHFSRFDEFLKFVAMSRFASDRKNSYLWILADSNWGKGLLESCMSELGIVVNISTKEIQKFFNGDPVGRSPEDFRRCFILWVNEFKTINAELKQLESHVSLAPKNKLTSEVEVFAKVFTSATPVSSLMTDIGVEDQLANRFSLFEENGKDAKTIDSRSMFHKVGKDAYRRALTYYIAGVMNEMVRELTSEERNDAHKIADEWVEGFARKNCIAKQGDRVSDHIGRVGQSFNEWILDCYNNGYTPVKNKIVEAGDGSLFAKSITKLFEMFVDDTVSHSELPTYITRKSEIIAECDVDGEKTKSRRYKDHQKNQKIIYGIKIADGDHGDSKNKRMRQATRMS